MDDTNGFYRIDNDGDFQYAPNFVSGPNYELLIANKDTYIFPIEGWSWYPNEATARIDLNVPV
jgi:hypothetical protein